MDTLFRDLRFTLRLWRRWPMVTIAAIFCLAFGIGATTTVFSLVDAILLRPLDFHQPDRLVVVWNRFPASALKRTPVSGIELEDYQRRSKTLAQMSGLIPWFTSLSRGDEPERLRGARVSANVFSMLGVNAARGRTFADGEEKTGEPVVILSHSLWQRRFGGDPSVVGTSMVLDGNPYSVVGIMPESFRFLLEHIELWTPLVLNPAFKRDQRGVRMVARLADGVPLAQAQGEMNAMATALSAEFPNIYPVGSGPAANRWGIDLVPLLDQLVGDLRATLFILLAAVALVLLIGCTNVASLLLAQAASRGREVSLRAALGAGRKHLFRQMITESMLLSLVGGGLGVLLARIGLDVVLRLQSGNLPRLHEVTIDARILVFSLGLSLLTGLVFGLVPALRGSRMAFFDVLKEGGRSDVGSASNKLRSAMVIAEVALALVVLVGTGLLLRSVHRLERVDSGFRAEGVLAADMTFSRRRYPDGASRRAMVKELLERLRHMPNVIDAAASSQLPFSGTTTVGEVEAEGKPPTPGSPNPQVDWRFSTPDLFTTIGIPLLSGRTFNDLDHEEAPQVVIIDRNLAKRLWGDEDPVGKRLRMISSLSGEGWRTVVGVVGSIRHRSLATGSAEILYAPYLQAPAGQLSIVLRTQGDPEGLITSLRRAVQQVDPDQPLSNIEAMDDRVSASLAAPRFHRLLFGLFGAAALVLASVGVYSLVSHSVALRRREIGLRAALGAEPSQVERFFLGRGMRLIGIGLGCGLFVAVALAVSFRGRLLSLITGVDVLDPLTFAAVPLILAGVALIACMVPARRAARIDPMVALRQD